MAEPVIKYYRTGEILSKSWHLNGIYHRTDGPAIIDYFKSGEIQYEEWYLNNKQHRTNGPASISCYETGEIKNEYWWLNGKDVYPEEWLEKNGYKWPLNKEQEIEFLLVFG